MDFITLITQVVSVEKNSFDRAGHTVETMDTISEAPELISEDIP